MISTASQGVTCGKKNCAKSCKCLKPKKYLPTNIFFWFDKWSYTKKDLSFIRINWMGAKTRDNKVDWLYPTTQCNYDGNLPKKYSYCFGAIRN